MVDMSRNTSGVSLPTELSNEIWSTTVENSVVMAATRQINLPGSGITVHSVTGEPVAQWTAETDRKPVSRHTLASKPITPYKLAVIEPFSMEFRRDLPGLYRELARRLPFALASAFDSTVFGTVTAPGANFDQLSDTTTTQAVTASTATADLVAAYQAAVDAGGDVSAWLGSPTLVGRLITALSAQENFNLSSSLQVGSVFGAPVLKTKAAFESGTIGFAGDFQADAVYGTVEGVQVSISDQATLTDGVQEITVGEDTIEIPNTIDLWQQNMFAVRAEIEVGFRVSDVDRFVELTAS